MKEQMTSSISSVVFNPWFQYESILVESKYWYINLFRSKSRMASDGVFVFTRPAKGAGLMLVAETYLCAVRLGRAKEPDNRVSQTVTQYAFSA